MLTAGPVNVPCRRQSGVAAAVPVHAASVVCIWRCSFAETAGARARRRGKAVADPADSGAGLPDEPAPHVFLSRLARESNDLARASDEGVKAVRLAPNNGPALRELATTMFAMQNYEAARAFYVRAIRADSADHTAQGYLGCSLIRLGRAEEGQRWIQRAGSGTWSACR